MYVPPPEVVVAVVLPPDELVRVSSSLVLEVMVLLSAASVALEYARNFFMRTFTRTLFTIRISEGRKKSIVAPESGALLAWRAWL